MTLTCIWIAISLAPVFPLIPWFWPLLLMQIINGGALSFAWSGTQTLIAQLAEGDAGYLGRFSAFARVGTAVAPIIAGRRVGFRRRLAGLYARRRVGRGADAHDPAARLPLKRRWHQGSSLAVASESAT